MSSTRRSSNQEMQEASQQQAEDVSSGETNAAAEGGGTRRPASALRSGSQTANEQMSIPSANSYAPFYSGETSATASSSSSEELKVPAADNDSESSYFHDDHFSDTFAHLNDLRLEETLCDVVISVGSHEASCHRVVLAAASGYFRSMFTRDMKEARLSRVAIHDITPQALDALLDFCYSGTLKVSVESVQQLLFAATVLQMEAAVRFCCLFMHQHLHPANAVSVRLLAETHGHQELAEAADKFLLQHFLPCAQSDDFTQLSASTLRSLLLSDELTVDSESQVLQAVLRWAANGEEQQLPSLLEAVRLELLPPEELLGLPAQCAVVRNSLRCRDLLDAANRRQMERLRLITETSDTPKARPRRSTAGVLFCVGGRGTAGDPFRSIECFDWLRCSWFMVPEMSTRRRHVGVVSTGKRLYAVGGHDGVHHLNTGEVFDLEENKWSPIANMKHCRRGLALACLGPAGSPIYAVGGLDDTSCYSAVELYDPKTNSWSSVACMAVKRGGVGLAVLQPNRLLALGGNDGLNSLDSCELYDPFLNRWSFLPSMHFKRAGAGVTALQDLVYAVGGFNDNLPLASTEVFSERSRQWTVLAPMSCARGGVGAAPLAGRIFTVGGHDGSGYLSSVESYDPETDRWKTMSEVNHRRAGAGVCHCDWPLNKLLAQRNSVVSCV